MTGQGDVRLEELDTGDGQERGGGRHLRLVAGLALCGLAAAYLLYGAGRHGAAESRPAAPPTGTALTGPLPAGSASPGDEADAGGSAVQVLLLRPGTAPGGRQAGPGSGTLIRYGVRGVLAARAFDGFVAPLVPGVQPAPFPLGGGRSGLLVGLWQSAGTRLAVLDDSLSGAPVPLRASEAGGGTTVLSAGPKGIWTTTAPAPAGGVAGAAPPGPVWGVQVRPTAAAAPRDVPEPGDLTALAGQGADFSVLGLLRAPGTRDDGVLVSVSLPGQTGVELRAEWPDGRATRVRVGALVALGPDYALVADAACPGAGCGLSVVRLTESGAVARQEVRAPAGWSYQDGVQQGAIAFTGDGFVLPVTARASRARALAYVPARGGQGVLVPGSAGLADRADGCVLAAAGSTVVFEVAAGAGRTVAGPGATGGPGSPSRRAGTARAAAPAAGSGIRLAWWDSRESAPAHYLSGEQPAAALLAALAP